MWRLLSALLLTGVISACEKNEDTTLVLMPVYGECIEELEAFSDQLKNWTSDTDEHIVIRINKFNYTSEVHKDLVGYLEIESSSNAEELPQYIKEIELMCFPRGKLEADRTELGLRVIDDRRKGNDERGITSYFSLTDEKYIMYYNQEYKKD